MAIAFVNRSQGGASISSTTIVSVGITHTAGNLLVAMFTFDASGGNFSSIADTAGNTWTQAGTEFLAGPGNNKFRIYYAYNCLGNIANIVTVTLSAGTVYRSIVVYQFSGVQLTDPINSNSTGTGSSTAISTGTLNITTSEGIICAMIIGLHDTIVGGTGYTLTNFAITGDVNKYFADEYKIITANEAATASQGNGSWDVKAASFGKVLVNSNFFLLGLG